jgi:DNA-binding response OmpR family regulator
MRILIIENEPKVADFIKRSLEDVDYSATVAGTCFQALGALAESPYDAVILDLGLPDGDGLTVLKEWRAHRFNEPVLILSARDAVHDRIRGLNLGADDYLAKPFSMEELLARLRSLLRRHVEHKTTVFEHRGMRLDLLAHTVTREGKPIDLTGREFALLELFMQNEGRVLTRNLITEKIWDSHDELDANLLDVYMRRLRKKLSNFPEEQLFRTVRGVGYQLI